MPSERLSVWGILGYGTGALTLAVEDKESWTTDTTMEMAAAGARGVLVPGGDGAPHPTVPQPSKRRSRPRLMCEGKGNAPYSWPATLQVPQGPRVVYLDLNHWITLAKALTGHPDGGRHRDILDRLFHSVEQGHAVFPLSLPIYVEVLKIADHRRRSDLRKVILVMCLAR